MTNSSVKRKQSWRKEHGNDGEHVTSFCSLVKNSRSTRSGRLLRNTTPRSRRSSVQFPKGVPTLLGRSPSGCPQCPICHTPLGTCSHTTLERLLSDDGYLCGSRAKRSRVLQLGRGESNQGKEILSTLEKDGNTVNVPTTPVEFGKWALPFPNVERNPSLENLCCSCWAAESIVISFRCDTPLCGIRGEGCAIDTPCDAIATHGSDPDTPARCALHKKEDMKEASIAGRRPHVMCRECWESYTLSVIREGRLSPHSAVQCYSTPCPIGCPGGGVDPICFEILGRDAVDRYCSFVAMRLADDMSCLWCPHVNCGSGILPPEARLLLRENSRGGMTIQNEEECKHKSSNIITQRSEEGSEDVDGRGTPRMVIMNCPRCSREVCFSCKGGHGEEVSCKEWQNEQKEVEKIPGDTKRCPCCGILISRISGCNHMTCQRCEFEFCWVCLTPWTNRGQCMRNHWADDGWRNTAYNGLQRLRDNTTHCSVS